MELLKDKVKQVPAPGGIARVRQRRYLVEEIAMPTKPGDSTLVKLSCLDDDNQGQPLEVLWERELDTEIISAEDWDCIGRRGFDESNVFAAFFNTLRWNCVTATDPRLFQSPFRAGIRLDAYQLEPLRKALLLPRVNLFIADDVGLGKTIEAGLIARELLLRKKARDIVVSCPPSMLIQWKEELESRFGLTFEILDKDYMTQVRRERGFAVNPWSTHSRFLISHRLLIDENYAAPLRDWLSTFRPGSLLILDEAHNAAPASGQKYAIDSQLTRAIRDIAPRFEHRLFLSATPHNGHSNSFSALLEILDPQRFCRGVPVKPKMLDSILVRRLKDDLREVVGGFAKRVVKEISITGLPADAPELRLAKLLDEYRELRETRLKDENKRVQAAAGLLVTGLQQRLLSSIEAFARTLHVHRKTVKRQWEEYQSKKTIHAAPIPRMDLVSGSIESDDDRLMLPEHELVNEEEQQIEMASQATIGTFHGSETSALFRKEQSILDEMHEIADAARGQPDARISKLIDWVKSQMCPDLGQPDAKWTDIRAIVFTEYDDTRRYLQQQLEAAIVGSDKADQRIRVYYGQTPSAEREEIKHAFNAEPSKHPVRILIATDAAREGLNLQAHCWNLFHFDVPWNPSRMEQRNGRIDRKLQPNDEVFCHYFVYDQRPEDRILAALVRKTETIKQELGSLSQVIDSKLRKRLEQGIRRNSIAELESAISVADLETTLRSSIDEELESSRKRKAELKSEIERLDVLLKDSKKSIGLDKDQFRSAISCALEMIGAEALRPTSSVDRELSSLQIFQFPSLERRTGADPTWVNTMDALRIPRRRDEKPWDWRRTAGIRPVVFEEPNFLSEDVVHLHLEHRVVQRLLSRFSSQGFIYHDLSRACLSQSADSIPRVILLGRLCLYGPGAARLHEELIPITARWSDPGTRKQPLAPYAKDAEAKSLELLENALVSRKTHSLEEDVRTMLQKSAARDVRELLQHLEQRGDEYARDAEQKLSQRAAAESRAMREILETQKKHITSTIAQHEKDGPVQLRIKFVEEEARQIEANKKYWERRLETLELELESEPERVRQVYEVRAKRIEPVGMVYLWPVGEE